ncbi:MAG: hypothetical protein MHPSP_003247, partial [Paramarteilia canceri]
MAENFISKIKGKENLEKLVKEWNKKHDDNKIKTEFSDMKGFNENKNEIIKEIINKFN